MKTKLIKKALLKCLCMSSMLGVATTGGMALNLASNSEQVQAFDISDGTYAFSLVDENGANIGNNILYSNSDSIYYRRFSFEYSGCKSNANNCYLDNGKLSFDSDQDGILGSDENIDQFIEDMYSDAEHATFTIFSTNKYFFSYTNQIIGLKNNEWDCYDTAAIKTLIDSVNSSLWNDCLAINKFNTSKPTKYKLVRKSLDEQAPALENSVFFTSVSSPVTLEYILSQVKFVDEVDGDLPVTQEDVEEDNYTSHMNEVGKWTIKVHKSDRAGNEAHGVIEVWVQDVDKPVINGQSMFTSNMSKPLTDEEIKSKLSISDNYDHELSVDDLVEVSDDFRGNEQKKGTYHRVYKITDASENESAEFQITINVVDDIKPTISLKEGEETTITTSYKNVMSIQTILDLLKASDNVDGDITLTEEHIIENTYTNNSTIPSTYTIKLRVQDSSGNYSDTFVLTIVVEDKIPPVFYVNGLFIAVSKANTLSHQDIVNLLIQMSKLQAENVSISFIDMGGYKVDAINNVGTYNVKYQVKYDANRIEEKSVQIKVLGEEAVTDPSNEDKVNQRLEKFKNNWNRFWKNVGEFFVKAYRSFAYIFTLGKVKPNWKNWY